MRVTSRLRKSPPEALPPLLLLTSSVSMAPPGTYMFPVMTLRAVPRMEAT
jgi:hypothetical protein